MDAKLTLNMDKEITRRAKAYAKSKGRSLSGLVEDYFRFLTHQEDPVEEGLSPKIKSLLGSLRVPDGFDYKKEISDRLSEKFMNE
jgi:hypothetical protein